MSSGNSDVEGLLAQRSRFFCPLISYRRQRQMLSMLFRELALGARHRFALDLVAESIAASPRLRLGARYLHLSLLVLLLASVAVLAGIKPADEEAIPVAAICLAVVGGLALFFLSLRPHEDFLRHVAGRLADSMAQGRTLSEAMWGQPMVFSRQERQVVTIGEQTGHLAESLDSLADYNLLSGQLNRLLGSVLYPIFVLSYTFVLGGLIWVLAAARFSYTFADLGIEMPAISAFLFSGPANPVAAIVVVAAVPILVGVFVLLILVWIPRMLGGSVVLTVLFLLAVAGGSGYIYVLIANDILQGSLGGGSFTTALTMFAASISGGGVTAVAAYFVIRWLSSIVPRIAGATSAAVLGRLGPLYYLELSRFFHSLGFSLRAKIPAPDALEMAGHAVRGQLRRESLRFRAMIETGHSFAECLKTSRRFPAQVTAILSLAEWRGSIADDCVEMAGQLHAKAVRSGHRLAACIEWPSVILIGVVIGAFAVACYLPFFKVPIAILEQMP